MRITLAIAINDLRVFLSDRGNYVTLVIMPVILSLILGLISGGEAATTLRVDIINQDNNSDASLQFLQELRAVNEALRLCPMDDGQDFAGETYTCRLDALDDWDGVALTEAQALERVRDKISAALIIIPANYGAALRDYATPIVIQYYSLEGITTGGGVLQSVQAAAQRVNGAVVAARVGLGVADTLAEAGSLAPFGDEAARLAFADNVYDAAIQSWGALPAPIDSTWSGEVQEAGMGFDQSVPGMATMFVMFTALGGLGLLLIERKQWTLQRLVVLPITRAQILGGKILARFTIGLITFAIMIAVGLVTGVNFGQPLAALLIMLSYTLCITALAFAVAPFLRSEEQAAGLTVLLSICLAALGGAWWPLEVVPQFMQIVGHISPVAWAMDGFSQLIFYDGGLTDILVDVAVLLAASMVLFGIGIRNFRYE